jgi:hypothetical protein
MFPIAALLVGLFLAVGGLILALRPRAAQRYRDEGGLDRVTWDATDHGSTPGNPF